MYVSSEFAPRRRFDLETNEFELLWVEIKINSFTLLCGACYRPEFARNEMNIQFMENLQYCIDKINQEPNTFLVLLGDFNSHYDSANPSECSDFGCLLYRWFECNNLHQVIAEPTRVTETGATLLVLIITNYPGFFVCSGTYSPPSKLRSLIYFCQILHFFFEAQVLYSASLGLLQPQCRIFELPFE